jgi:1-acyl-sn-glycerol-3-phosphate acyltransferase
VKARVCRSVAAIRRQAQWCDPSGRPCWVAATTFLLTTGGNGNIIARRMSHRGSVAEKRRWSSGWRALRTGVAFCIFGVGALCIAVLVFPIARMLTSSIRAELFAQRVIHRAFRVFIWTMTVFGLIRISWRGMDGLREPGAHLIVANHPTLIDVVVLIAALPQADCVVKRLAWRNVFIRGVLSAAGYIANDHGEELVEHCRARLRMGRCLLLFPEGTRSPNARLGTFHRGAARIALASGCDIVPVVIHCDPPTLMKGQHWFDVPDRTVRITVDVQPPVSPAAYEEHAARAARRLTADLRFLFEQELRHAAS